MKYPISFDIELDDEFVAKRIADAARECLIKKVCEDAETIIFTHRDSYLGYRQRTDKETRNGLNEDIKNVIAKFMDDNKEEILNRVADNLTKRLANTKQAKAILGNMEVTSND